MLPAALTIDFTSALEVVTPLPVGPTDTTAAGLDTCPSRILAAPVVTILTLVSILPFVLSTVGVVLGSWGVVSSRPLIIKLYSPIEASTAWILFNGDLVMKELVRVLLP